MDHPGSSLMDGGHYIAISQLALLAGMILILKLRLAMSGNGCVNEGSICLHILINKLDQFLKCLQGWCYTLKLVIQGLQ